MMLGRRQFAIGPGVETVLPDLGRQPTDHRENRPAPEPWPADCVRREGIQPQLAGRVSCDRLAPGSRSTAGQGGFRTTRIMFGDNRRSVGCGHGVHVGDAYRGLAVLVASGGRGPAPPRPP